MFGKILINNAIAIAVHVVFYLLLHLFFYVESQYLRGNSTLTLVIYILVAVGIPLLYVLCGRMFLYNTGNVKYNIMSVIALIVIISIIMVLPSLAVAVPEFLAMVNLPFVPLAMFMQFLPGFVMLPILTLLPSALLYIGLALKSSAKG